MQHAPFPTASKLVASHRPENFLGSGGNGEVYKIDGETTYVMKILHDTDLSDLASQASRYIESPHLHGRNFGQAIASYGPDVTLLLYQHGKPCGIPFWEHTKLKKSGTYDEEFEKYMHAAARQPLQAYVELLNDVAFLENTPFQVDGASENMLIDTKAKRFRLIDLKDRETWDTPNKILCMLFDDFTTNGYRGDISGEIARNRRVIFGKMLMASVHCKQHFTRTNGLPITAWGHLTYAGLHPGSVRRTRMEQAMLRDPG